jgi:hypothetical protein
LRIEFVQYLLQNREQGRALSELLILIGNIPDEVAAHNQIGEFLILAGDTPRALAQFRKSLRLQPENATSLAGAAMASFLTADYRGAQRYFRQLPPAIAITPALAEARTVTDLVFRSDPLAPGLPMSERRMRLDAALAAALQRLTTCATASSVSNTESIMTTLANEARAERDALAHIRDRQGIERGFDLADRFVAAQAEHCGPATPREHAVSIIARRHEGE